MQCARTSYYNKTFDYRRCQISLIILNPADRFGSYNLRFLQRFHANAMILSFGNCNFIIVLPIESRFEVALSQLRSGRMHVIIFQPESRHHRPRRTVARGKEGAGQRRALLLWTVVAAETDNGQMDLVVSNATAVSMVHPTPMPSSKYLSILGVPFAVPYTVGMLGNLLAMCVLHRTRTDGSRKHGFMLRCLVFSDAVALNGLLVLFFVNTYRPGTKANVWTCRFRVLMRFFSVESGCVVTFVMTVERWLALTKPFAYHRVRAVFSAVILLRRRDWFARGACEYPWYRG